MGLFLELSAAVNTSKERLLTAVRAYAASEGYELFAPDHADELSLLILGESNEHSTALLPPAESWDVSKTSRFLSEFLQTSVFSFHIHDGSLWMFELFDAGERITGFNTVPDYWGELDPEERSFGCLISMKYAPEFPP